MTDLTDSLDVGEVAAKTRAAKSTVYSWITGGVFVAGVGRVRLAAVRVGAHYRVPPDALAAFLVACNPAVPPSPAPAETPAQVKRRGEEAKRRLAARLNARR